MTSAANSQQDIATDTYTIDPAQSVISFKTKALWGLMGVKGTFEVDHGRITVADPVTQSTVEAAVSAASFASGITQRDEHVRSADYLDADKHPLFVFRGERFEQSGAGGKVHGQLTVKGITQPVTLDVEKISGDSTTLTARATVTIDRFDYGITLAPGKTGRKLRLTLDVVATR